jgi:glucuronoarabinoxylan endo-1,4-beta-xylanase
LNGNDTEAGPDASSLASDASSAAHDSSGSDSDSSGGSVADVVSDAISEAAVDATATDSPSETEGGIDSAAPKSAGMPNSTDVVVDPNSVHQLIAGFGASSAWEGGFQQNSDADTLFSTTNGAGLSLLRVRIAPDGTTGAGEVAMATAAQARGARVWATPWSPPPADKSNDNTVEGTLTNSQAFANTLAQYVATMKSQGINLLAVSAENEPDANVSYESCSYTGATLASFIGSFMGPALDGSGVSIIGPETQNWCDFPNYAPAIFSNTAAASYTSIIATHEYGCTPPSLNAAVKQVMSSGKQFWETEIYDQTSGDDPGMGSALRGAGLIYDALTIADMNAWHYWWIYPNGSGNGALWDNGTKQPAQRLWVMGNFSRFARPGFYRVDASGPVPSGVSVIGFQNPSDNTIVVVAINTNTAPTAISLFVSGVEWPAQVTPWLTASGTNLVAQASIPLSGARFSATLAGQSVTTFVGKP